MPTTLGDVTRTLFFKSESHKLFNEFEVTVDQAVVKGQPVVLAADGTVTGATNAHSTQAIIGVAMHDGDAGDLVTVMMKGYLISFAAVGRAAGIGAGPVALAAPGLNPVGDRVYITDDAVTHLNQIGWALDAGDQGDEVLVCWL